MMGYSCKKKWGNLVKISVPLLKERNVTLESHVIYKSSYDENWFSLFYRKTKTINWILFTSKYSILTLRKTYESPKATWGGHLS